MKKIKIINSFKLQNKFDLIFFAAGYASPMKFTQESEETILTHSIGLVNSSKQLKKNGTLIYLSSSEIYNGEKNHFSEHYSGNINYDNARAPYINGKKFGETYCKILNGKGFNVKILRISLTYGPGAKTQDTRVINELIMKAIKYKKINLIDNGSDKRKYLYINDCMEIMLKITKKSKFTTYNITGNSKTSILNLAQKISKKMKVKYTIPKEEKRLKDAPKIVNIDNSRVKNEFKKNKYYSMSYGLNTTISWYKTLL